MDGMSGQFFARAGFAIDEHAAIGRRHQPDLLAQRFHRHAVAHDQAFELQLLLEIGVFLAKALGLDRVLNQDQGFIEGKRFFQEIVSSELGRANRGFDGAVTGNHDHLRRFLEFADFL